MRISKTSLPILLAAALATLMSGCGGSRSAVEEAASALGRPPLAAAQAQCLKGRSDTDTVAYVSIDGTCTPMSVALATPGAASVVRPKTALAAAHARFTWPSFLAWATTAFPQFFRGRTQDGVIGEYTYRYWPDTGHYLGIVDGERLYALGPATDDEILYVGTLGELLCGVYPANCAGTPPAPADVPGNRSSTAVLELSSTLSSTIGAGGDEDWFAVDLLAGTAYIFEMEASSTGKGSLSDPYLRLHDAAGLQLASNDDVAYPTNLNARIPFTPSASGRYFVAALGYASTGSYQLSARPAAAPDIAGDRSTTSTLSFDTPSASSMAQAGDEDWFAVDLVAGTVYTFDLEGASTGQGTLQDPFLDLYNGAGQLLASSDDVSFPSNLNSRIQFTAAVSGRFFLAASAFSDQGTYRLTGRRGTTAPPTPPVPPTPPASSRIAAIHPVTAAVASGSVGFRYGTGAMVSGSFTPSPDGFETEFTAASRLFRWIDRAGNLRIEAEQASLTGGWTVVLYDDNRSDIPYPMGFGKGHGYPLAVFNADQVVVRPSRGTVTDRAIDISFTPRSSAASAVMLSGTLTGNAPQHLWGQAELPRSSSGTVFWNGIGRSVVSTTVNDNPRGGDPEIAALMDDGTSFTARASGGTPPKIVQTRLPSNVVEFQCGPSLGGACDYTAAKNGSYNAVFSFSTLVWAGASRSGPSTRFEGTVEVGQQYSTLTVNGVPFPLQSGNFGVATTSPVSSVGDTARFRFSAFFAPGASAGPAVDSVNVWRRGNRIVQVQVPGPNGSQFICTETASDSRTNVLTHAGPAFTIPACPGLTALFPIGGNVRGFEFSNFRLNAAPSLYAVPLPSIVLDGVLVAKGL